MLLSEPGHSDQPVDVHIQSNTIVFSVVFVVKSVKKMERVSRMIQTISSRGIVLPLNKFCCCFTLKLGIRVIAAMACAFGVGFVLLGTALDDDEYITNVIAIACHVTGFMYFLWLLLLLLLLSLDINLPKKLVVWIGYVIISWLLISVTTLIVLVTKRKEQDDTQIIIILAVLTSIVALGFSLYCVWTLKSYFCSLRQINLNQSSSRIHQVNVIHNPTVSQNPTPTSLALKRKSQILKNYESDDFDTLTENTRKDRNLNLLVKENLSQTMTRPLAKMASELLYQENKESSLSRSQQTSPCSSFSDLNIIPNFNVRTKKGQASNTTFK